MTGEEMERAIEFLIQSQAKAEARLDRTEQLIAESGKQIERNAETVSQFIEIVTRTFERLEVQQAHTDKTIAEANRRTDQRITELNRAIAESNVRTDELIAKSNARTDERIAETNKLIGETNARIAEANARIAEANTRIAEVRERGAETDARLDRIAALVERNISGGNGNS